MASYTPLLQHNNLPNDEDEPHVDRVEVCDCDTPHSRLGAGVQWEKRAMRFAIYACLASMACTFLNISFLAFRKVSVTNDIKYAHTELEMPNSYIGLERAIHDPNSPPPKPITNFPLFTAQVNQSEPNAVYYEDNRHFTNFGTAWPTDRKFRVGSGVSTIVQFRVQDFGMEKCTLTLSTSLTAPAPGGRMDLWKLDKDRRLDPHDVSWKTRPSRSRLVISWDLGHSAALTTDEFPCKSTSILTFELACSSRADCTLQFIQPRNAPESAFLLVQRSSL
ncbi:hypothetical protein B0H11DRAFT_1806448 [Mycena galericulata]|nr:hypothetical protein B0H11DRAFT_1806448 [Mycena galericulata]